ncbi:lipid IV(A) 3-deoxy-D-manno-octulosonic acid transferase [Nitratifractor sp.]
MFAAFYTLVAWLLWLAALPIVVLLSLCGKYRRSLPARFLLWTNPPLPADGIWFHVCSFGEARAIRPLAERFDPGLLRLSTTTRTGYDACRELAPQQTRYLPFEPLLWFWTKPQKALVVMEAELWYLLFHVARARGAKTFLINARISDRSWPSYRRFAWFYRRLFAEVDRVFAQTERDRERLEALGARRVEVVGNLKLSAIPQAKGLLKKPDGYLVCAASTHEGEESAILEGFRRLKSHKPEAKLLLVPRHPERFDRIEKMARGFARLQEWSFALFSEGESLEADLILIDRMGLLVECYAISDLVVLGGAFEPIGGHNAAEAAQFGLPVISGPHFHNQQELFSWIEGITVVDKEKLAETMEYPALLPPTKIVGGREAMERIEEEIRNVL